MTPQALAEASAAALWRDDHATHGLGMTLDRVAPGEAAISMMVEERMTNGHGLCHGGFIFTLADSCFAFACNSFNHRAVAQNCTITFLRPAHRGDRLTARGARLAEAGRSGIYDIIVTNQQGAIIATFRGQSRRIEGLLVPEESTP